MVGKPVVTETENSKVTRQDLYYEIIPSEIPEQWHVRLHYQEYGWYSHKRGWFWKTIHHKHFHEKRIKKYYQSYDYGDGKEIAFASIPEAKKYITHLQKKPERVYIDA